MEEYYDCTNTHDLCQFWADHGECEVNPNFMLENCQKSCHSCIQKKKPEEEKKIDATKFFKEDEDIDWITEAIKFGEKQRVNGKKKETLEVLKNSVLYMNDKKTIREIPKKILDSCLNRHELCAFWVSLGECENNPAYMVTNCAPSCLSCDKIDFESRCPPRDPDSTDFPALRPGELNSMFQRIVEEGNSDYTNYTVTVHSYPKEVKMPGVINDDDDNILDGPWVVTFENFLSATECEQLIQVGYETENGYERSKDVGNINFDGSFDGFESKTRTSANAWCSHRDNCRYKPTAKLVMERLSEATGIPPDNSEDFQILRYDVGQFYRSHHDYIGHQKDRLCGPRILTFFLYLSDVDAGGGTAFPRLNNLTVVPKMGRALLWPSILDADPSKPDMRTQHEALTVLGGRKYAANAWIHLYDYITPSIIGCT